MDKTQFIANIADLFEDTDPTLINETTEFKSLEEWSSLLALSLIAMIDEEYEVTLMGDDVRNTSTLGELFDVVTQKQ